MLGILGGARLLLGLWMHTGCSPGPSYIWLLCAIQIKIFKILQLYKHLYCLLIKGVLLKKGKKKSHLKRSWHSSPFGPKEALRRLHHIGF